MRCLRFHAIGNHYAAVLTFIKLSVFGVMLQVIQTIFIPRAASPIVIVERSTESIHTRTVIGNDYIFAVVNKRAQCALFIVEFCRETIAADFLLLFCFQLLREFLPQLPWQCSRVPPQLSLPAVPLPAHSLSLPMAYRSGA